MAKLIKKIFQLGGVEISRSDQRAHGYAKLYARYRDYTMIPEGLFLQNLQLCEAFKHIGGDFVECGVWKGGMSAAIAEVLGKDRQIHLFDSFEGLPPAKPIDGQEALAWQQNVKSEAYYDNCTADEGFAIEAMRLAGHGKYQLHKGWFDKTMPGSIQNPIGILRLDGDWYDSIFTCLQNLFPRVSEGGIVVLDDYYTWDGCAKAVHDYLSSIQSPSRIFQWNNSIPFIVKKN
jgi:hypothetical protein